MTPRISKLYDWYLRLWAVGATVAGFGHLLTNHDQAEASQWAHSPGWQREIGMFNFAVAFVLLQVLRRGDDDARRMMARTGILLSLLLGANHIAALLGATGGPTRIHWTALVLNVLNGGAAGALLAATRRSDDDTSTTRGVAAAAS